MDALTAIRLVHFAATLVAGGTIWFALLLPHATPPALTARLRGLALLALIGALLSGIAWLVTVAAAIQDVPLTDAWRDVWPVLTGTRFGEIMTLRLALALLLIAALALRAPARLPLALIAVAFVALPAAIGHSGATPGVFGAAYIVADVVHLAAAAAWLGGLPGFAVFLASANEAINTTRRFGRMALISVAVLAGSGLANSWHLLHAPTDLIETDYGRWLTLKLALFAGMLTLAAVNRFQLTPALPAPTARRPLIYSVTAETVLGLGVVAVVAVLGTLPPGGHVHQGTEPIPDGAAFVHIHDVPAMADVTIDPGTIGSAAISIRVSREDFSEFPARAVLVTLTAPGAASGSAREAAATYENGVWRAQSVDLNVSGTWIVHVLVTPIDGPPIVLDAPIVIAP